MHSGSASLGGLRGLLWWGVVALLVAALPTASSAEEPVSSPIDAGSAKLPSTTLPSTVSDDGDDEEAEAPPTPDEQLTSAIRSSLSLLTGGTARYDGKTLSITYADGNAFRNDLEWISPKGEPNYERRDGRNFAGHTEGMLLLKPHFRGDVRFEAKITYQWIERGKSHFMMLVHATPTEFLGSNFGVHAVSKLPKKRLKQKPSSDRGHRKDPSQWIDRTGGHVQVVSFKEPSTLTARYQGTETELDLGKKSLTGGRVGFLWKGTKFFMEEVKISGELDRDWAKKLLKFEPTEPEKTDDES